MYYLYCCYVVSINDDDDDNRVQSGYCPGESRFVGALSARGRGVNVVESSQVVFRCSRQRRKCRPVKINSRRRRRRTDGHTARTPRHGGAQSPAEPMIRPHQPRPWNPIMALFRSRPADSTRHRCAKRQNGAPLSVHNSRTRSSAALIIIIIIIIIKRITKGLQTTTLTSVHHALSGVMVNKNNSKIESER